MESINDGIPDIEPIGEFFIRSEFPKMASKFDFTDAFETTNSDFIKSLNEVSDSESIF